MGIERRIHPRTDTRIPATVRCNGAGCEGIVENIGRGGVFFSTADLELVVDVGATVDVELHIDGRSSVTAGGTVLRADRYFDGADVRRSLAVKFDAELDVSSLGIGA